MTSVKLVFEGECRRIQKPPETLEELVSSAEEIFRTKNVCLTHPDTALPFTGDQYRDFVRLSRSSTIRISVSRSPARAKVALPLFPQCSSCLQHMTGDSDVFQLQCKHVLCGNCVEKRTIAEKACCNIDKTTSEVVQNTRIIPMLRELKAKMDRAAAPFSPAAISALKADSDLIFAQINEALIACGFLVAGDCPMQEICRYEHTSKARALARTLQFSLSSKPPLPKNLPVQEDTREESKQPLELETEFVQKLPSQPMTLEGIQMGESCVLEAPQQPAGNLPQSFLSHIQKSVRESIQAMNSLRLSQLSVFREECSICGANPILGCLFRCSRCSLSMCPECEQLSDHPHPLYKIKDPAVMQSVNPAPAQVRSREEELEEKLQGMGFRDELAVKSALKSSNFNLDLAVQKLLFG